MELLLQDSSHPIVEKRAQCLLLSHKGASIHDLSTHFHVCRHTIEIWFDHWESDRTFSLQMKTGKNKGTIREIEYELEGLSEFSQFGVMDAYI